MSVWWWRIRPAREIQSVAANGTGGSQLDLQRLNDVLRCSSCGAAYAISDDQLSCTSCDRRFVVVDGIPVLLDDSTIGTALERFDDYSAHMGIDASVINQTGTEWKLIISQLGLTPEHALEIGAGTGALTLGLLEQGAVA